MVSDFSQRQVEICNVNTTMNTQLSKDVFEYLLKFRPTYKSVLKGFLEKIETHSGPDNEWNCRLVWYDAIPNLPLEFQLREGKLACAFVTSHGCVPKLSKNGDELFHFLEMRGVDLNKCV